MLKIEQVNELEDNKQLTVQKEVKLICHSCNKPLVSLLIVQDGVLTLPPFPDAIFIAICPRCKVKSIKQKLERVKIHIAAIEPFQLVDTEIDDSGEIPLVKVKLK